jgi:hypothetical protein
MKNSADSAPKLSLWPATLIGRICPDDGHRHRFYSFGGYMSSRRNNPIGPALIIALFFAFFLFSLASGKGNTGNSHPQAISQNR